MPGEQQDYKAFRQRLDAELRRKDPEALRAFLIAEGQWQPEQQTDTEAAMWMMIAASPALKDIHGEAERWLLTHGHEAEAGAILGARRGGGSGGGRGGSHAAQPKRNASGTGRSAHTSRQEHMHREPPRSSGAPRSPQAPKRSGPRHGGKPPR